MKLDKSILERLIKEEISRLASIGDIQLNPEDAWDPADKWRQTYGKKGDSDYMPAKAKLKNLYDALGVNQDARLSIKNIYRRGPASLLKLLADNGLAQSPADQINNKDLELSKTSGQEDPVLPSRGDSAVLNLFRLEFLAQKANGGDTTIQNYLNQWFNSKNVGFLQKVSNVNKDGTWCADKLSALQSTAAAPLGEPDTKSMPRKDYEAATISEPSMRSQRAERGIYSPSEFTVFNEFRGASLKESIQRLSEFSMQIMGSSAISENDGKDPPSEGTIVKIRELLTNVMMMDYLVSFTKEMDHGSGAYFFEGFLAWLAGGVSAGRMTGASGGMGESDFIKGDGTVGSAKYLQTGADIEQSVPSFVKGRPVEYIVAYKTGKTVTTKKKDVKFTQGVSDPDKLQKLAIFSFPVTRSETTSEGVYFDVDGERKGPYSPTGKIKLKEPPKGSEVGDLILAKIDGDNLKSYRKSLIEYTDGLTDANIKKAFGLFRDLAGELIKAKELSQAYASSGDVKDGKPALESIKAAKEKQEGMMDMLSHGWEKKEITENKQKLLDKLIKEVILEEYNGD